MLELIVQVVGVSAGGAAVIATAIKVVEFRGKRRDARDAALRKEIARQQRNERRRIRDAARAVIRQELRRESSSVIDA